MNVSGRLVGTGLVGVGGLVECVGIGYVLVTGASDVDPALLWVALGVALVGTLGAALAGLALTGRLSDLDAQAATLGAVTCVLANAVLLNAPPPADARFRLLFLAGAGVLALSGVLSLVAAVFEGRAAIPE